MLDFLGTRTKILAGVGIAGIAGAVISGVIDYRDLTGATAPEMAAAAAETVEQAVLDAADTTESIVGP